MMHRCGKALLGCPGIRLVMLAGRDLPLDNLPSLVSSHLRPLSDIIMKVHQPRRIPVPCKMFPFAN